MEPLRSRYRPDSFEEPDFRKLARAELARKEAKKRRREHAREWDEWERAWATIAGSSEPRYSTCLLASIDAHLLIIVAYALLN